MSTSRKDDQPTQTAGISGGSAIGSKLPPSRVGKKPVTAYVSRDVHKQLRMLGLELDKSNQEMLSEALEDYFARHRSS